MERKKFLSASLCLGALCGVGPAAAEEGQAEPAPVTPCDEKAAFTRVWIKRFMDNLDAHVDEPRRLALMEARGRSCARGGPVRLAEADKGNLDKFVSDLAGHVGPEGVRCEGDVVKVAYPTCFCPLVAEVNEALSPTYCHCSVGWLKEMFETASGKPVRVEVVETVKRGGKMCRFDVRLEA
jgi:hypothetical protein